MRLKADLTLLLVAMLWGMAFGAQRATANIAGVWWFNGSRFLLAALALLPLAFKRRARIESHNLGLVLLTSLVLTGASALQQAGLRITTAANAGFITSLYVVLVPVLGFLFFRRKTSRLTWIAAVLALFGAVLLSTGGRSFRLAPGDGLELAGAVLWAIHLILVDRVVKRMDVLSFAVVQYFIAGAVQCALGVLFEINYASMIGNVWWSVAYTGIISVAVGYTLQAHAQRIAPPADAAVILSTESVFAALTGYLMIGEVLMPIQVIGCVLIFLAVLVAQLTWLITPKGGKQAVPQTLE